MQSFRNWRRVRMIPLSAALLWCGRAAYPQARRAATTGHAAARPAVPSAPPAVTAANLGIVLGNLGFKPVPAGGYQRIRVEEETYRVLHRPQFQQVR